ncbi:MAG: hypothetical protein JNK82_05705 [Myxococcaceae bacterium]|nr:hypothetical protein [Myxococcaceae bacterium]
MTATIMRSMAAPDRPWFLCDVDISDAAFRERLRDPDPVIRAQWQGALLREATVADVWRYVALSEVLENWVHIARHLGRRRAFWEWLIRGWREDGRLTS